MKFFKKLFTHTLTYKTYDAVASVVQYVKDYDLISDTFYSDEFGMVLRRYLNKEFKKDWIGRLYAVINPNIDIDGHVNFNNTVIELDDDRTNSDVYTQNWIYKQMSLVGQMFKLTNMYAYISVGIEHVGPVNADNYLVVFDIASRQDMAKAAKKFSIHLMAYAIIAALIIGLTFLLK